MGDYRERRHSYLIKSALVFCLILPTASWAAEKPTLFGVSLGAKFPKKIQSHWREHSAGRKNGIGSHRFQIPPEFRPLVDGEAKATPLSNLVYVIEGSASLGSPSACAAELARQKESLEERFQIILKKEAALPDSWLAYTATIGALTVAVTCMHGILYVSMEDGEVRHLAMKELFAQ